VSDETLRNIIYVFVILMAPINLYATYRLLSLSHRYDGRIGALSERATVAGLLSIGSIAGSVLAVARLFEVSISPTLGIILNGVAAFMLCVPALIWLYKYGRNGFEDKTDG
jgi:hypothetical protein